MQPTLAKRSEKQRPRPRWDRFAKAEGRGRVPLIELTRKLCHFPFGTVGDEDFGYCGKPVLEGTCYCEECWPIVRRVIVHKRRRSKAENVCP